MAFTLDANTMMLVMIVIIGLFMFVGPLMWFISWFFKRKDRMVESPIDVHEMLYHKFKKAARRNLKAIPRQMRPRVLHLLGDNDAQAGDYAKLYGVVHSRDCMSIFFYNGKTIWLLSKVIWFFIPIEMTRDLFGRNLCVKSRGMRPKANYQIPVWTEEVSPADRERLEKVIDDTMRFYVEQEKYEEMYEQNVNSSIEAINAKASVPEIYRRDEHLYNNSEEAKRESENQS